MIRPIRLMAARGSMPWNDFCPLKQDMNDSQTVTVRATWIKSEILLRY